MTDYMAVDTDLPPYFPYPQFLMDMPLSHTAALTYALLLDRAHLSQLNGWTDEAGRVYLIFPVEKIAAALKRSLSSAKNVSAPGRFCSFSPNRKCRKMAGKGVQPLDNYTCRFCLSSLKQADKSGLDRLQAGKLASV